LFVTGVISVKVLLLGRSDAVVIYIYSDLLTISTRLAAGVNHELDGGDLGLVVVDWGPNILLFISLVEFSGVLLFAVVVLPALGVWTRSVQVLLRR